MKFMELKPYGLDFKNIMSGPAPVGRMLNYIKQISSGNLFYNGIRTTSEEDIADAWCANFMFGLDLIYIDNNGESEKQPLRLTENGKKILAVLPDSSMSYDVTSNVNIVINQLGDSYEDVKKEFEVVFRHSLPFKNLSIFLADTNYWFQKKDFYWKYYNALSDEYDSPGVRSENTAANRIPSIVQCCVFIGYALEARIGTLDGICFYRDKFDFRKEDEADDTTQTNNNDDFSAADERAIKKYSYNRIVCGAPGTGKSFNLNEQSKLFGSNMERVTFYPRYSYGQFVGMYKPIGTGEGEKSIAYKFVPGPFMRIYVKALKEFIKYKENGCKGVCKCFLLLIEEINRAKAAAVFGDVFQLLDREAGESIYPVSTSEDVRNYIAREVCGKQDYESCTEDERLLCITMKLPPNMYIWATMNSADQGVEILDTAFKRRWENEYVGINDAEEKIKDYKVPVAVGTNQRIVGWNDLRKGINKVLSEKCFAPEDKLLGPFFMSKEVLEKANSSEEEKEQFIKKFKSKVIMYLFSDAAMGKSVMFSGCENPRIYSSICASFDDIGEEVFGFRIE